MNQAEQALLIQQVTEDVVESFKPTIREFEREGDRLIGEINVLRRRLTDEQRNAEKLRLALADRQEAYDRLNAERLQDQHTMLEISTSAQRWAEASVHQDALIAGLRREKSDLLGSLATTERLATNADKLASKRSREVDDLRAEIRAKEQELVQASEHWQEVSGQQEAAVTELHEERDRLLGTLATSEAEAASAVVLASERAAELQAALEGIQEREQQLVVLQATFQDARQRYVLAERVYDDIRRPKVHDHATDEGNPPVIVFDLHGTLTPSPAFVAVNLPGFMEASFDGVKEALEVWAGQGICLHIATAGLDPSQQDPLVRMARKTLIEAWYTTYGLPISWVTGNVRARAYYDDRMVPVYAGNWEAVGRGVEAQLAERTEMLPSGIRKLIALPEQGELITDWPDPADVPPDRPRGLSTRILDVDIHRCLSSANSSTREGRMRPGAAEVLQDIWDRGYGIHLSCAGWDPLTHTQEESSQRKASLQMQAREAKVPFDQLVAKDHGTVFVNDKGLAYRDWKRDHPLILRTLAVTAPDDEASIADAPKS